MFVLTMYEKDILNTYVEDLVFSYDEEHYYIKIRNINDKGDFLLISIPKDALQSFLEDGR